MIALRRMSAAVAQPLADQLADIYDEHYAALNDPFHGRAAFLDRLAGHLRAPDYLLVAAWDEPPDVLVGYIYGYPLQAGTGWWTTTLTPLSEADTWEDGRRTLGVNELNVRARYRRQGIATRLHQEYLCERDGFERVTLSVDPDNSPAYSAYRSWGYQFLAKDKPLPNSPVYDDLILPLP